MGFFSKILAKLGIGKADAAPSPVPLPHPAPVPSQVTPQAAPAHPPPWPDAEHTRGHQKYREQPVRVRPEDGPAGGGDPLAAAESEKGGGDGTEEGREPRQQPVVGA